MSLISNNHILLKRYLQTDAVAGTEYVQVSNLENHLKELVTLAADSHASPPASTDGASNHAVGSASLIRNGFSVARLGQNQLMKSMTLLDHTSLVYAIEFSNDGSLLVSGGDRGQVFIRKMEQVLDSTRTSSALLKVTSKNFSARSLAISADNSRIFAGGSDHEISVFDTNT